MRSLEFENDDLFNEPGRVYRGAAADITEYSNPLGELKITTDDYEYLHEVINDATSYNWTDDQYEALLTPLHKMVDAPLARFIEGVIDGDPRVESDRFNEQLVSILQNNYQRYGTEPRAAVDGVIMALQRGYSQAQNMWGDDVEIDESGDDLFEPQTGGKYWSNSPPEYEQLYAELVPAQGPAETLEGELLRAASRLYYQYFNNGWMNNVSASENFLRNFAEPTTAMQRALHTIRPYTREDVRELENKQTARQVEIALDTILTTVIRQVQSANGNYHPNPGDMFDYEEPDDDTEPADDYDDNWTWNHDEDDEDLAESDDDLFLPKRTVSTPDERLNSIVQKIMDLVAFAVPDGDPMEYVGPYMKRMHLSTDDVNQILNRYGYNDINDVFQEFLADRMSDEDDEDLAESDDDLFAPSERVKILHAVRGMKQGGDSNGTSRQGTVRTTYAQLLRTFGKPMFGPDDRSSDKVTCAWEVTFSDGAVATIYDWLTRATPRGEYDWHIGGHRKVVAEYVRVALDLGRDATVMEEDDLFEPRTGYIPPETVAKLMPTVDYFIHNLENDGDMIRIQQEEPEAYSEIIRDFQGAAQELRRGNVIKALAYLENAPISYDLDDWFYTVILRKTGIDITEFYDSDNSRHEELFRKYQNEIRALKEYGMGGFVETKMKEVREFVEWTRSVVEADRKKSTKTQTDQPGLDPRMFDPRMDQPLARQEPEPAPGTSQPRDIRRASAARTRQATAGITPTDQMSDMLSRLRDIEVDPNLEPYPTDDPTREISVDVTTQNLPAVAGANMQAAGVQNPEFYQVAALPGNMAAMIRQLGKNLFGAMTSTPTNNIYVVANLGGQGPNTTQEVNAVAGYLRDHGVNIGPGDIDFSKIMPGYQAETNMFSAGGIRWLLVRDFAGQYIYAWPEADSVDYSAEPRKLR